MKTTTYMYSVSRAVMRVTLYQLVSEHDSPFGKIVRCNFDFNLITWKKTDFVHAHLSGKVAEDDLSVVDAYAERCRR